VSHALRHCGLNSLENMPIAVREYMEDPVVIGAILLASFIPNLMVMTVGAICERVSFRRRSMGPPDPP